MWLEFLYTQSLVLLLHLIILLLRKLAFMYACFEELRSLLGQGASIESEEVLGRWLDMITLV